MEDLFTHAHDNLSPDHQLFFVIFPPALPLYTKCAQLLLCSYHFSNGGRHLDSLHCCKYYANFCSSIAFVCSESSKASFSLALDLSDNFFGAMLKCFSRPGLRVYFPEASVHYFELFQTGDDAVAAYGCCSGWSPEAYILASSLCHAASWLYCGILRSIRSHVR